MRIEFLPAIAIALGGLSCGPAAQAAPSAAELEQAGNLFAITCSSSMCHGDGGVGARGPALRNRDLAPDFVRNTILQGRSGTPMPSFKDSLTPQEVNAIVAYVMSLGNQGGGNGGESVPTTTTVAAAPQSEQAQAGAAIFFDIAHPVSCAECHTYGGHGGPVGPDLTAIAKRTPPDIYQGMVSPKALNPDYPMIGVSDHDGKRISGVVRQKTDTMLQLYDLSSIPPVLRSFHEAGGVKTYNPDEPTYRHDLSSYSKDDIASLIAFLKSASGPSKDVTPQDFAQP